MLIYSDAIKKCSNISIQYYVILYDGSLEYLAMLMNRQYEKNVIWTYFMIDAQHKWWWCAKISNQHLPQ